MGHRDGLPFARTALVVTAILVLAVSNPLVATPAIPPDGAWQQFAPPPWLIWHAAIYDPVRDRMVLFGGIDGFLRQAELWELSFVGDPEWRRLQALGAAPPPLYLHGGVYDPVRDRMLVIGGSFLSGTLPVYSNQVWALSLSGDPTWSLVTTAGVRPVPRTCREMVYDSIADRILIFGGNAAGGLRNDLWSLSLADTPTWSPITPAGTPPSSRYLSSIVFDPLRDRVIVFGGGAAGSLSDETWELTLAGNPTWRLLAPSGARPLGRSGHSAFYDPAGDRMIVLNGTTVLDGKPVGLQDSWSLSLGADLAWSPLAPTGAAHPGGSGGSVVYDSQRQRAVFFGGWVGNTSSVSQAVWTLSLGANPAWSTIVEPPHGPKATGRRGHSAVFDPVRHRMIVFGGWVQWVGEPNPYVNDLWSLDLDPPYAWTRMQATGVPPSVRWGHTAVYDPVRDRMIVFGGEGRGTVGDLWELTLSSAPAWHPLAASGNPPPARSQHTAIYDPVGDRMLLFGGISGGYSADVWELSLASPVWRLLPVSGPAPRAGHTAIYDPAAARMIVFGGFNGSALGDLWQLELAGTPRWEPLTVTGTPPAGRRYHAAVYDARRQRMLLLAGAASNDRFFEDLLELSLVGSPQWKLLAPSNPPLRQFGHSAIFDPVLDGLWTYGGHGAGSNVVRAYWPTDGPSTPVWIEDFALEPVDGGVAIRWRVTEPARAEEFELSGSDRAARWAVPIAPDAGNSFLAEDRALPPGDGDIRYTLVWNDPNRGWVIVAEETWARGAGIVRELLHSPRPNPSRGAVEIPFVLARAQTVRLTIEDVAGRVVRQLHTGPMASGTARLAWNGVDASGRRAASGVYFVRLVTASGTHTRKVVLAR